MRTPAAAFAAGEVDDAAGVSSARTATLAASATAKPVETNRGIFFNRFIGLLAPYLIQANHRQYCECTAHATLEAPQEASRSGSCWNPHTCCWKFNISAGAYSLALRFTPYWRGICGAQAFQVLLRGVSSLNRFLMKMLAVQLCDGLPMLNVVSVIEFAGIHE